MKEFLTILVGAILLAPTIFIFTEGDFICNFIALMYALMLVCLSKTMIGKRFTTRLYKAVLRFNKLIV